MLPRRLSLDGGNSNSANRAFNDWLNKNIRPSQLTPTSPSPTPPPVTPTLPYYAPPAPMTIHVPQHDTAKRQNEQKKWPNGVLWGRRIIDIIECLSTTGEIYDYEVALWLRTHYVEPFGRIDGLDGLVVTEKEHLDPLLLAYERFINIEGKLALAQRLWVPGLEPIQQTPHQCFKFPELPGLSERKKWRAGEAFVKNGLTVQQRGTCEGGWRDERNWKRMIWSASTTASDPTPCSGTPATYSNGKAPRIPVRAVASETSNVNDVAEPYLQERTKPTELPTTSCTDPTTNENVDADRRETTSPEAAPTSNSTDTLSSPPASLSDMSDNNTREDTRATESSTSGLMRRTLSATAIIVETLDDIVNPDLRQKTKRMGAVFPYYTFQQIFDALVQMKGDYDDTGDLLASKGSVVDKSRRTFRG